MVVAREDEEFLLREFKKSPIADLDRLVKESGLKRKTIRDWFSHRRRQLGAPGKASKKRTTRRNVHLEGKVQISKRKFLKSQGDTNDVHLAGPGSPQTDEGSATDGTSSPGDISPPRLVIKIKSRNAVPEGKEAMALRESERAALDGLLAMFSPVTTYIKSDTTAPMANVSLEVQVSQVIQHEVVLLDLKYTYKKTKSLPLTQLISELISFLKSFREMVQSDFCNTGVFESTPWPNDKSIARRVKEHPRTTRDSVINWFRRTRPANGLRLCDKGVRSGKVTKRNNAAKILTDLNTSSTSFYSDISGDEGFKNVTIQHFQDTPVKGLGLTCCPALDKVRLASAHRKNWQNPSRRVPERPAKAYHSDSEMDDSDEDLSFDVPRFAFPRATNSFPVTENIPTSPPTTGYISPSVTGTITEGSLYYSDTDSTRGNRSSPLSECRTSDDDLLPAQFISDTDEYSPFSTL